MNDYGIFRGLNGPQIKALKEYDKAFWRLYKEDGRIARAVGIKGAWNIFEATENLTEFRRAQEASEKRRDLVKAWSAALRECERVGVSPRPITDRRLKSELELRRRAKNNS